jgi:RNA polymerase sigma-70 factor, ECF subfamily
MDISELKAQLEKYHSASYGWALSCCSRDPVEAESVLQNVYLKALEGKARYDGRASFKTWLFSVIRKTAADARRWNLLRRLRLINYEAVAGQFFQQESMDEAIYRSQIQSLFRQALATLPKRQQEVLQLVFYHELSLQEAAQVMEVSIGSARTHYDRGKKRLRELLKESKVFDESSVGREENKEIIPGTEAGG